MILLSLLFDLYDALVSSLLKKKTILIIDDVLMSLLKINNEMQLASSTYEDYLVTKSNLKASLCTGRIIYRGDIQVDMKIDSSLIKDVILSAYIITRNNTSKGFIKKYHRP